jgi:hypothetical protein
MTRNGTSTYILCALILVMSVGGGGCARQQRTDATDARRSDSGLTSQPEGAPPATAGVFAEGLDSTSSGLPDTTSPVGGTLAELRARLRAEALRLDRAVSAARLDEVSSRALRVRDLSVALGGKTTGLTDQKVQQIESDVAAVIQIAEKIRAQAAAGDAAGVKARNVELQGVVARMVKVSAPAA